MKWRKVVNQRTLERQKCVRWLSVWRRKMDDPNLAERCERVARRFDAQFRQDFPEWTISQPALDRNEDYGELFLQDKFAVVFEWHVVMEPVRDGLKQTVQDFVDGKIKYNYRTVGDPADGQ